MDRKSDLELNRGDMVEITCGGRVVRCTVDTAINWAFPDQPDNWYIEGYTAQGQGAIYWKQEMDGGSVKLIRRSQ